MKRSKHVYLRILQDALTPLVWTCLIHKIFASTSWNCHTCSGVVRSVCTDFYLNFTCVWFMFVWNYIIFFCNILTTPIISMLRSGVFVRKMWIIYALPCLSLLYHVPSQKATFFHRWIGVGEDDTKEFLPWKTWPIPARNWHRQGIDIEISIFRCHTQNSILFCLLSVYCTYRGN
jgi:hypothetical protein